MDPFETERLLLRPLEAGDSDDIHALYRKLGMRLARTLPEEVYYEIRKGDVEG